MYLLGEIKLPQIKLIHSNAAVLKDVCWFSCVSVSAAVYWDSKQKECRENGPLLLVQQYKYWPKSSSRHYISILINLVLYLTVGPIFFFFFFMHWPIMETFSDNHSTCLLVHDSAVISVLIGVKQLLHTGSKRWQDALQLLQGLLRKAGISAQDPDELPM